MNAGKRRMSCLLIINGVLFLRSVSFADTPSSFEDEALFFADIKVEAATKTEIKQIESPQAVTVLTKADIGKIPATNLGELLRSVVGANIVRTQTSQNLVSVRGSNVFSPSKTLILIDNQPIDVTLFSTTWWELVPVSMEDIERIEIIRSPGTIYGANAQNGVVNIITQKPDPTSPKAHHLKAVAKYGQQDMNQHYLGYLGRIGKTAYRFSGEFDKVDAYTGHDRREIIPGRFSSGGEQTFSTNDHQLNLVNFSGLVDAKIGEGNFGVQSGYKKINRAQGRIPDRLCFVATDGYVNYANARYSFDGMGVRHTMSAGNDRTKFAFLQNDNSVPLAGAAMSLNKGAVGYEGRRTVFDKHTVLAGVDYSLENAANVSGVPFLVNESVNNRSIVNAHVQDEWRIFDNDRLYLGGLYSYHYVSGSTFAPLAAYVHKINDQNVLRLATYTSYRNPNVFEHSMDYDQTTGSTGKVTRIVSNRGLSAEKTVSYELGLRTQPSKKFYASTDLFLNHVTNGIEWTLVGTSASPSRPQYQSRNTLEQTIGGVEVDATYQANRYLGIQNNVAFTSVFNESSNASTVGATLRGANGVGQGRYGAGFLPPWVYNAIVNADWRRLHTKVHYQYTAAHTWQWPGWTAAGGDAMTLKPVPGYSTVGAHVGVDVMKHVSLAFEGVNLFDTLHTEWRGDESYFGRQYWGKLTVEF